MSKHFLRQIDKLKGMILALGRDVEQAVEDAISCVENRDMDLAWKVIENDRHIDLSEVDVEEECLHTLALHQPVAFDLRLVVSVVKINKDLERIADLAVNIAEQAIFLLQEPPVDVFPFDFAGETERVKQMLNRSLQALVNVDPDLAEQVRHMDDEVDIIHQSMYPKVEDAIRRHPDQVGRLINLLNISRQLERIADHTVNIAEDVLYMARGEIQRHSRKRHVTATQDRNERQGGMNP